MLTKKEQLYKNKKPKSKNKNKSKITQQDKDYLNWLQSQCYPCFVCGVYNNIEWHHVKNKSTDRKRHDRLIPLCVNHHRMSSTLSAHNTPKKWRETYSMEEQEQVAKAIYEEYLNE